MTRREAIAYLTKDGEHLRVPCSRYGSTGGDCAPVAYRAAVIYSEETGYPIDEKILDHLMSLTVNDHDDIEHLIRSRPHPERYLN